jgi:alkyl sulfatase BDS1-like metallo-beta-lactamase superfamily hydrolase
MTLQNSEILTEDPLNSNSQPPLAVPPQEITKDLFLYRAFVNTYALKTDVGLLIVDPGSLFASEATYEAIRKWTKDKLHTAVYTHGHIDHAFGLRRFIEAGERPNIIAQENCLKRFQRYRLTRGLNTAINRVQFSRPQFEFPDEYFWPTLTFRKTMTQTMGDLEIRYYGAKGETDDHCYVWIPKLSYLFPGDFIIWRAPNCGNPQKVQRYPLEWAEALEHMASLEAEWLFPGHGLIVHGKEAVHTVLMDTARYLRVIIDQVLELLNLGKNSDDIIQKVNPDPDLSTRPYLQALYDNPQFIVRNLLRLWGGWWNGNAADLLPAPWEKQAKEIVGMSGGVKTLVQRGRKLLDEGDTVMASHIAEWVTRADQTDRGAQELKRDVYAKRIEETESIMAQGIFRAAMNEAKGILGEKP